MEYAGCGAGQELPPFSRYLVAQGDPNAAAVPISFAL